MFFHWHVTWLNWLYGQISKHGDFLAPCSFLFRYVQRFWAFDQTQSHSVTSAVILHNLRAVLHYFLTTVNFRILYNFLCWSSRTDF